jgi:hypothetical protein
MKQHITPLIVQSTGQTVKLERVSLGNGQYDESWLQTLCFNNPTILPIGEIEPAFDGMLPICQEMQTASGPCDLVYVNETGFITIAECKLWRNPEARRQVVGQILDYAKDLSQWDYTKFEHECLKARKSSDNSLYGIVAKHYPDLDASEFIDRVQRNLRKGRFLLLIIGDGIRENMESLVQYLQGQGALNFSMSLLEVPVFKHPYNNDLVLAPRILAKTTDLERTVIRVVEKVSSSKEELDEPLSMTTTVSEKVFYERLTQTKGEPIAQALKDFVEALGTDLGIIATLGRGKRLSLNLKSPDDTYNFASVQETGEVWFYGIVTKTAQLGDEKIGVEYLHNLAALMQADVDKDTKQWSWSVKRNKQFIMIEQYLAHRTQWQELIRSTLQKLQSLEVA